MKTGILIEILFLKKMRQIALQKNLGYKFDTSKENLVQIMQLAEYYYLFASLKINS